MLKIIPFLILFFYQGSQAQVSSCFEIERILVDACGNTQAENENEMVRFVVGPNPLNVNDLTVGWPSNNSWQGTCMNATTAAAVAAINSTILSCGLVLEPLTGVLPAHATVILAGSENFNPFYHSFASLSDTVYIIFQCGSSATANFKNYDNASVGSRTLEMDFGTGCYDVVTYFPYLLVTPTGQAAAADGASVVFDASGNATYVNEGCQAPFSAPSVNAQASASVVCSGGSVALSATMVNAAGATITWTGGSGTFSTPSSLSTDYFPGAAETGTVALYINALADCGILLADSVIIEIPSPINSFIELSSLPPYCNGETVALTINGADYTNWSTGESAPAINVMQSGIYPVIAGNECYTVYDTAEIQFLNLNGGFYTDVNSGMAPLTVAFIDSSNGGAMWQWDFGDGNTAAGATVSHTYSYPGQYQVLQIVHNTDGCTDSSETTISVAGPLNAFIPAAFSPNSDTKNEVFMIEGITVASTSARIYNRWGNEIWSWENSEGWNGLDYDGNSMQQGIYIYDADVTFTWGETVRMRGWVMLLK